MTAPTPSAVESATARGGSAPGDSTVVILRHPVSLFDAGPDDLLFHLTTAVLRSASMGTDTRLALRRLAATPLFTAFAILSLAAGVAITTAMYSIVDGVFLRGQGIRDPDRLAVVVTPYSGRLMMGVVSEPDFRDLQ